MATPERTILIFDWDDTICPSSTIESMGKDSISQYSVELQSTFYSICEKTKEIISLANSCGDVVIITNSDEGWVKFSAGKFMPSLLPLLDSVEIVSARTRYESLYPRQPLCWKAAAFAHEVNERFNQMDEQDEIYGFGEEDSLFSDQSNATPTSSPPKPPLPPSPPSAQPMEIPASSPEKFPDSNNLPHQVTPPSSSLPSPVDTIRTKERRQIISFGDSLEERTAVKIVSSQLSALCKSVKFLPQPTPIMILGQLELLWDYMKHICKQPDELDLEISTEQAMSAAQRYLNRVSGSRSPSKQLVTSPPATRKGANGVRGETNNVPVERT